MIENERYEVVKTNDKYGVIDTLYDISIINHIHETQAKRVVDNLNRLNNEKDIITDDYTDLHEKFDELQTKWLRLSDEFATIYTENVDLRKENFGFREQIKEFERMPLININKKPLEEIRHENKFDMILDFWNWLGEQGLAYESLYYGDPADVEDLIQTYLKGERWVRRRESTINDATNI